MENNKYIKIHTPTHQKPFMLELIVIWVMAALVNRSDYVSSYFNADSHVWGYILSVHFRPNCCPSLFSFSETPHYFTICPLCLDPVITFPNAKFCLSSSPHLISSNISQVFQHQWSSVSSFFYMLSTKELKTFASQVPKETGKFSYFLPLPP